MRLFLTRVELHGATSADYERLHTFMEVEKSHRVIADDFGKPYLLPTAEYFRKLNIAAADVREHAKRAASQTGRTFWIIVVRFDQASCILKEA